MKKLLTSTACALVIGGAANAQKVDLDKFNFEIEYLELPVNYVKPELRTYSVNVSLSPMAQSVITPEEVERRVAISNFSKVESGGAVQVNVQIGNTTFNRSELKTRKEESKDKEGKVTSTKYYYSMWASYNNDGRYSITGPKNAYKSEKQELKESKRKGKEKDAPKDENPFLKDVEVAASATGKEQTISRNVGGSTSYNSPETKSSDDASRAFRINGPAIMQGIHNDFVNSAVAQAANQVNHQYGYVPVKESYYLWILDSKSHPEYQMQQNAIAAVKELLSRVKAESSTAALETALQPVMSYFETLKTKYTGDDKREKKLRYSAYFNLAKLYLVLDKPEKAIIEAQGLIKNDFDTEDGEDLLERAEELKREMDFHHINTRHLDRS